MPRWGPGGLCALTLSHCCSGGSSADRQQKPPGSIGLRSSPSCFSLWFPLFLRGLGSPIHLSRETSPARPFSIKPLWLTQRLGNLSHCLFLPLPNTPLPLPVQFSPLVRRPFLISAAIPLGLEQGAPNVCAGAAHKSHGAFTSDVFICKLHTLLVN